MLGIAKIADMGMFAAAAITAATALLGILALETSFAFGFVVAPIALMISAAVLAYVVLRHSEQSALNTVFIAAIATTVVALSIAGSSKFVLVFAAVCWISTIVVASVLRSTVSLKLAVLTTVPVAGLFGLLLQFFKTDIVHYWESSIRESLSVLSEEDLAQVGEEALSMMFEQMPLLLAESVRSWAFFIVLLGVFLARYWQAQLFNQGGFQKEFHALQLGKEAVIAFGIVFLLARLFSGSALVSVAAAMMNIFFIQGLSVLHCLTKQRGLNKNWLVGMYAMLWLPPTMIALSILGIVDNFFQIRKI